MADQPAMLRATQRGRKKATVPGTLLPGTLLPGAAVLGAVVLLLSGCTENLSKTETAFDGQTEASLRLADQMQSGGDLERARALYLQALRVDPGNGEAALALGGIALRAGRYDEAEGAFREAMRLMPDSAEARLGFARSLTANGRPLDALKALEPLSGEREAPLGVEVELVRGVALDLLGEHEEARAAYDVALGLAPHDLRVRSNRALSLALSGSTAEAVAVLREVATHPLADSRHKRNYAMGLAIAGSDQAALTAAREVLDEGEAHRLVALGRQIRELPPEARGAAIGFGVMGGRLAAPAVSVSEPPTSPARPVQG